MIASIQNIFNYIVGFPAWLLSLIQALFASIPAILEDVFISIVDGFMGGVVSLVASIPVPANTFVADNYLGSIPPDIIGMFLALQLPLCFSMLFTALTIRFVIGLIPFVRIGT